MSLRSLSFISISSVQHKSKNFYLSKYSQTQHCLINFLWYLASGTCYRYKQCITCFKNCFSSVAKLPVSSSIFLSNCWSFWLMSIFVQGNNQDAVLALAFQARYFAFSCLYLLNSLRATSTTCIETGRKNGCE